MVTFRAGNYPTQCPSLLEFDTEIRCVLKGSNFLWHRSLHVDWSVLATKELSVICSAEDNT